jgi:hypothetical protein
MPAKSAVFCRWTILRMDLGTGAGVASSIRTWSAACLFALVMASYYAM